MLLVKWTGSWKLSSNVWLVKHADLFCMQTEKERDFTVHFRTSTILKNVLRRFYCNHFNITIKYWLTSLVSFCLKNYIKKITHVGVIMTNKMIRGKIDLLHKIPKMLIRNSYWSYFRNNFSARMIFVKVPYFHLQVIERLLLNKYRVIQLFSFSGNLIFHSKRK